MTNIDDFLDDIANDDDDRLDKLADDVGQAAVKVTSGIRPMAAEAQSAADQQTAEMLARMDRAGIRPYDDSMGAARRYAAHFARGQEAARAFGKTHLGSARDQELADQKRMELALDRRKMDLDAGIRRREQDANLVNQSLVNSGAVAQENAKGMWGGVQAAADLGTAGIRRRSERDAAALGAWGDVNAARIQADSRAAADAAEKERQLDNQRFMKEASEKALQDAKTLADYNEQIRRDAAKFDAENLQQSQGAPGDGMVKGVWVNSRNGGRTLMYTRNGEMVDFDENKIPAPPNGLTQAGIDAWPLTGKKDDSTRKSHLKGLATGDDSYGLYYDRRKGRWLVLTINELRKEQSANLIPGLDHDAETYWTIVNAAKKEYADSGNKDSKKYSAR